MSPHPSAGDALTEPLQSPGLGSPQVPPGTPTSSHLSPDFITSVPLPWPPRSPCSSRVLPGTGPPAWVVVTNVTLAFIFSLCDAWSPSLTILLYETGL